MSAPNTAPTGNDRPAARWHGPAQVIVVSSVMFTFISYWRTAAVVLCDLASTAYYIGGIVEAAIGPAAPWFILAVMLFSYAVRSIYIESCSLFVRGGVYRVVKEAMGGFLAKLSVSALMFDYILTGPTSGVSAGQYIMGLALDSLAVLNPTFSPGPEAADSIRRWGAVLIAVAVTLYFYRENLRGIHESSDKALKIMMATTLMAVVMLVWCGLTLAVHGPVNKVPLTPDLSPKVEHKSVPGVDRVTGEQREVWERDPETGRLVPQLEEGPDGQLHEVIKRNPATGEQEDPLGFLANLFPKFSEHVRHPGRWWHVVGIIGLLIAFGHSILAMSGEETLAQVYREVKAPKMLNFKKAAFIVFVYSLALTASISFLAVLLIPDEVRMKYYADNLIGGLAMHVVGPPLARLLLNAFVVVVGFLILSGAVNTAIIGSNGVLNRVSEDGVLPNWFLRPHPRHGTTYRLLNMIVALQLFTIVASQGNMYVLGEAYAFGVVWSFVFKAAAMVVLRFKDRTPREFKVPGNIRIGAVEVPVGLILIFLVLLATAILNFFTKEVATVGGSIFTAVFLTMFIVSERIHERKRGAAAHHHVEQFNEATTDEVSPAALRLTKRYRKLVAIRSPYNLFMLEKALAETDPETTDVVVMTAKLIPRGDTSLRELDRYDQELMTAVVERAEKSGKPVHPLVMPTNNALYAVVQTAKNIEAQEVIIGASNKFSADDQLEQLSFYWISVNGGESKPLSVRLLGRNRDIYFDLAGGSRIPRISERQARSVAELRAAGIGVSNVLFFHDGTPESTDLFAALLTMLDPQVTLRIVQLAGTAEQPAQVRVQEDMQRASRLHRDVSLETLPAGDLEANLLNLAADSQANLLVCGVFTVFDAGHYRIDTEYLLRHARCHVCFIAPPGIPQEAEESGPLPTVP